MGIDIMRRWKVLGVLRVVKRLRILRIVRVLLSLSLLVMFIVSVSFPLLLGSEELREEESLEHAEP